MQERFNLRFQSVQMVVAFALVCSGLGLMSAFLTGCGRNAGTSLNAQNAHFASQALGAAASQLLKASPYSKLTIEVASVSGREPAQETLDFLVSFLGSHLNKPAGINVTMGAPIPATGSGGLTISDLNALEKSNRQLSSTGDTTTVYIMFLDNHLVTDTAKGSVLGLAYSATSLAVFVDTLRYDGRRDEHATTEKTIIAHEFGHILGLVNVGIPMADASDHYDGTHNSGHCNNRMCLMHYSVNANRLPKKNGSGQVPDFDEACLKDLRAAGGR